MLTNSGINKVFLVGNIGKDPILLSSEDQQDFLSFPLITTEVIKKHGEDFELTESHNIKLPKEVATLSNLQLKKGYMLYIEGKIQTRSFFDEQQIKKYKLEIIVIKLQVLNTVAAPVLQAV